MLAWWLAVFVSTATSGPRCRERYKEDLQDADFSERTCRGAGEYKARVDVDDARDDVILVGKDGREHALALRETISRGQMSEVRGPIWWWVDKKLPSALVVKLSVQEPTEDGFKDANHYVVAKITPEAICVVYDERKLADAKARAKTAASAPCLGAK